MIFENHKALQEYEKRIQQASKMESVGNLAGGIAHEFNNLFMAIAGYAFLIQRQSEPGHPTAVKAEKIRKRSGRTEFQRGIFEQTPNGKLTVKRTGKQGSDILTSMSIANCFIVLPEDSNGIAKGEEVRIQPFTGTI